MECPPIYFGRVSPLTPFENKSKQYCVTPTMFENNSNQYCVQSNQAISLYMVMCHGRSTHLLWQGRSTCLFERNPNNIVSNISEQTEVPMLLDISPHTLTIPSSHYACPCALGLAPSCESQTRSTSNASHACNRGFRGDASRIH